MENYQTLINFALSKYLEQNKELLEETLRRMIREELHVSEGSVSI